MRNRILLLTLVIVLAVINIEIFRKERLVRDGESVLLELAPRDPRSLMQGDYMVLRYRVAEDATSAVAHLPDDGQLVVALEDGVAVFRRIHDGGALAQDERLLRFRRRNGLSLGAESYFFEEGSAGIFAAARYGELRVAADGSSVLVGLRDDNREPLGPQLFDTRDTLPQ